MNSNVHPLVVVLVLVLTGIAIGTWMFGSGAAANIGGPAELKMDADGHAYIQIRDKLVEHDANGQYLATHDLGDMGVDLFLGSFDFFANGDILLRRGPDPRSFGDNFRAFQRKTNPQSIAADSPDAGLFRCELHTKQCTRFGPGGIDRTGKRQPTHLAQSLHSCRQRLVGQQHAHRHEPGRYLPLR